MTESIRLTRIYADEQGRSHFGEDEVSLSEQSFAPPAPAIFVSEAVPAEAVVFVTIPAGWFGDWHPAPARQFFVVLAGRVEVVVGDGETRVFEAGDAGLVEDTHGDGHTTRALGGEDARLLFARLAPDAPAR